MSEPPTAPVASSPGVSTNLREGVSPLRRSSQELFGGSERLVIEHRGEEYLLRITRQGKLILTK